ncbi:zinc fingers and homeoboxes protein 2-like [Aplochiton taeniatus]
MSRRRKSSNPCMIRASDPPLPGDQEEEAELASPFDDPLNTPSSSEPVENPNQQSDEEQPQEAGQKDQEAEEEKAKEEDAVVPDGEKREDEEREEEAGGVQAAMEAEPPSKGYKCKYCPFSSHSLTGFKEHVDSSHPYVILNPLYLCAVCNFSTKKFDTLTEHNERRHPGRSDFKFKRVKRHNQTVLEQTIEARANGSVVHDDDSSRVSATFAPCLATGLTTPDSIQALFPGGGLDDLPLRKMASVNMNGMVLLPDPSHVTPLLQRPPNFNCIPKMAVPLNTTKYNPSLDHNSTMMASFNRFPYPTHAELSWLTAASKHPEDQIKVWFTTQRLKQGITWTPEEVEEARKKMFNGSIPAVHHTFTTSSTAAASAEAPPMPLHAHSPFHLLAATTQSTTSVFNGLRVTTTTCTPAVAVGSSPHAPPPPLLKRPPGSGSTAFGPEAKRPAVVAPRTGDASNERLLMAPPPPPLKEPWLLMAPPPVPPETKRPVTLSPMAAAAEVKRSSGGAAPLIPSSSSPSSCHTRLVATAPQPSSLKAKAQYPGMAFPDSLSRSFLAPPIIAPPFNSYMLPPRSASIPTKEKHPLTHALLAPELLKLPSSLSIIAPQIRRPTIIQSVRSPVKVPPQTASLPSESNRLKEQQQPQQSQQQQLAGLEPKTGFSRQDKALTPLAEVNGVTRGDAKRLHGASHNGGPRSEGEPLPKLQQQEASPKVAAAAAAAGQFPLLERMKGKSAEQLKVLEENFQRNSFPSYGDLERLADSTRLARHEIDSWFLERRALRDNLEQALLNSMGSRRLGGGGGGLQGQMNGFHKLGTSMGLGGGGGHLKSPPPPIVAPSGNPGNPGSPCSVPAVDGRWLALLMDVFAQTRWPSPEDYARLEARTGLARTAIVRWFKDSRSALKSGSLDWMELFHRMNQQGAPAPPGSENAVGLLLRERFQDGRTTSPSVAKTSGASEELGLGPGRLGGLALQQANSQPELQEWLARKLSHQKGAPDSRNGPRVEVGFGAWLEDRASLTTRGKELMASELDVKIAGEPSGQVIG